MNKLFKKLLNLFFKGLLVVLPIWLSGYIIIWGIAKVDSIVDFGIPGAGVMIVLVGITIAGVFVTRFVTTPMEAWFDRTVERIPVFKLLYSSIRDLMEAFVGEEKKFNEPVLVELQEGIKKIGFLTQRDLSALGIHGYVSVYFPFSYTFTGNIAIVEASRITPIDANAADVLKFVVSGGVSDL